MEDLVAAAQAGDKAAFAAVCGRFAGLVKKYARQPHLKPIAAEAEAAGWLAVVEAVRTYDPRWRIRFAGYADSKVRFAVWNLFKRERRRWQDEVLAGQDEEGGDVLADMPSSLDVAETVTDRVLGELALRELAKLPPRQRTVLVLTELEGVSLTAVARRLGISVQAVHNLRRRGLARLRAALALAPTPTS